MGGKHQVKAGSEEEARGLRFVAAYCGLAGAVEPAGQAPVAQVATADGQTITGYNTVCRFFASQSPQAQQLLGATPELDAQVSEWLSARHTQLTPLTDDKLAWVNGRLAASMYLLGHQLTLADLVLLTHVWPAVASFPEAQTQHFCNLLRWADLLQHTCDGDGVYPRLQIRGKPRFRMPPPPPAPAAKPDKSSAAQPASKAAAAAKPAPAGKGTPAAAAPASKPAPTPAASGSSSAPAAATPAASAAGAVANGPAAAGGDKGKSEKKEKPAKEKKEKPQPEKKEDAVTPDMLDIRVGKIVKVERHPNAEALYLEQIDLGEDAPRQVISGLVKFVSLEKMQDRRVLVVTNLKPAKMRDVMSYGMVLCASNDAHDAVDPVAVPEGVPLGERVTFAGFAGEPEAVINPKRKIFERLAPDLQTDANGVANYKGVPFMTSRGPITATIPNAHVA